jgi:hypothetical protein
MKSGVRIAVIFWLMLACGALGKAQEPSQEMKDLTKALSGDWTLNVKIGPTTSSPNGSESTGTESWRAGAGGFTLLEEEHLRFGKQDVFMTAVVWWDPQTKSFHGMECQNVLPYVCDVKGSLSDITMKWDGKQFVIDENEVHGGKKSMWHEAWSDFRQTSFTQTGDSTEEGGSTKRLFTIHATRAAAVGRVS